MNFYLFLGLLVFFFANVSSSVFNDDKLFRIFINSPRDAELVHNFMLNNSEEVDLWNFVTKENTKILGQLKGQSFELFKKLNLHYEIANHNVTELFVQSIQEQKLRNRQRIYLRTKGDLLAENFDLDKYHSYEEITEYLKNMEKKSNPNLKVKMISIGTTYEERNINALIIGEKSKILLLECGVHAREWVSGAACLKAVDRLLVNQDQLAKTILENYEVHIIPILNPDGYEYTRNNVRDWRKNRSANFAVLPLCRGTDVNRNFDIKFGTVGVDAYNPCSLIYCGKKAFSEKESQALRDHVLENKDKLHTYISLHSFSQLILYPYGFSSNVPENNPELTNLARLAHDAIKAKQGEEYKFGNIYTAIYPASGSSLDWVTMNSKTKYSYCFEMRDTGEYGFMLPERFIDPAFNDVWIGLEQMITNMKD